MTMDLQPQVRAAAERWIDNCECGPQTDEAVRGELVEFAGNALNFVLNMRNPDLASVSDRYAGSMVAVEQLAATEQYSPFDRAAQLILHQMALEPVHTQRVHVEGSRGRVGFAGTGQAFQLRLNNIDFDILRTVDHSQQPPKVAYTAQSHGIASNGS